jgi:site-specific recombinase XerD
LRIRTTKERNEVGSRDIQSIRLPRWGRVAVGAGAVPWLVFNEEGRAVEPIRRFLIDFVARDNRPGSVRSYAFDLLRWWRWLRVVQVEWDRATSAEVRDFVLWLRVATKPRTSARTASAATAGTTNTITKKPYLDDLYKPRTIRHSIAVLRSFYEFWIESGSGPLVNPVPLARSARRRPHAHHT